MSRFTIHDLAATIDARAASGGEASYTRKLLDKGAAHCAKKLGEEAVETVIAAIGNDREHLIAESADLLFHLLVLLKSRGVGLDEVEAALAQRTTMSGLQETTARVLQALLARWSPRPKVDLVTTDGFLYPNAALERLGLMQKKGFPASYDLPLLLSFLSDIKSGRRGVRAPVYSHLSWDIVPNQWQEVDQPDILIVEGVNVLQTGRLPRDGKAVPVVSDFFDFSVYIDADEAVLREWYVKRWLTLRDTAFHDPRSYFHRYAPLSDEEAIATATAIWERTNLANLEENILPTRPRATLILKKGADHVIETVALRRL